jgi:methyl-accepting chemotaxis protein
MDKAHKKTLEETLKNLSGVKDDLEKAGFDDMIIALQAAKDSVTEVQGETQEGFDDMSETQQQNEKGQRVEEIIGQLEEAISDLDEVLEKLSEVTDAASDLDDVIGKLESTTT